MFLRPTTLSVLTAIFLLAAAPAAAAQAVSTPSSSSVQDRGKKRILALFSDAVSVVNDSVVRVLADGKEVALGTVVTEDGNVLTKGSDLKGELLCVLRDGTKHKAFHVGYHKPSDLALIKMDAEHLKPIKFLGEDPAALGNWVAAVGTNSDAIAVGVVSVKTRKLFGDQAFEENSNRGMLGVHMKIDSTDGVLVEKFGDGSPARKAGLRRGDVIVEVAGKPVTTPESLKAVLENYAAGDTVSVRVTREGREMSFKATLASLADIDQSSMQNVLGGPLSGRRTGFPSVLQHDTVLKPTDCGGPLVDLDGKVLGINIARAGRVETWAIPGNVVRPILKDLLDGKYEPRRK